VASRAFLLLRATAPTSPELAPLFTERDERLRADLRTDVERGVADGGQLRGISMQRRRDAGVHISSARPISTRR
jgi:hypothetical protein